MISQIVSSVTNPQFMLALLAAIAAAATVLTIAIPLTEGNNLQKRMKNVATEREKIRARERERRKMRDKIRAVSTEAKTSAAIIGALPPTVGVLVWLTTPKYIELLWLTQAGKFALVASGIWMLIGVLVMRKMINFDI